MSVPLEAFIILLPTFYISGEFMWSVSVVLINVT